MVVCNFIEGVVWWLNGDGVVDDVIWGLCSVDW